MILPLLKKTGAHVLAPLFLSALASASALLLPKIIEVLINQLKAGTSFASFFRGLLLFSLAALAAVGFKYFSSISFSRIAKELGEKIRLELFDRSLAGKECVPPTVLTHDIRCVSDFLETAVPRLSGTFWLYGLGFFFLAGLDGRYLAVAVTAVAGSLILAWNWYPWLKKVYCLERIRYGEYQQALGEWIPKLEGLKIQAREESVIPPFLEKSARHLKLSRQAGYVSGGLIPLVLAIWGGAAVIFIWIGAEGIRSGTLSFGTFVASLQYLAFFSMPSLELLYAGDLWQRAKVAWDTINDCRGKACLAPTPRNDDDVVYLPKHPCFFSRSLLENFLLMHPVPSGEEIERALRAACLLRSDEDSPEAWLERNPNTFSSGEKKRAALARLFLAPDAKVWILDKPAEGLDPETRDAVLEQLEAVKRDRKVLIL